MLQLTENPTLNKLLIFGFGSAIGVFSAFALYVTKPLYPILIIVGVLGLLPTFVVKRFRIYWFGVFLFSLQFEISKNLNDGLAVVNALQIDYTMFHFTFELYATDLIFGMLLLFWANDIIFRGKRVRLPAVTWLAVGYLLICLLSFIKAPSMYLSAVEFFRQLKFFLIFIYAVNNVDSIRAVKVLALMAVVILTIQSGVTIARYQTGYLQPLSFGESYQDQDESKRYLAVDREDEGSATRGFGTLTSPGSTLRLCMMLIPLVLMLCVRNRLFGMRWLFLGFAIFGMGGLLFTFTRAYYLTSAIQLASAFFIFRRSGYFTRIETLLIVIVGVITIGAVAPKLYHQFTKVRTDSVSVRLLQYSTAVKMIAANPLLGVGLNNGTGAKENYVTVSYDERDPDTQFYLEPTHNLYLSLASEIGIPAFLLFITFFYKVAKETLRVSRTSLDADVKLIANGLLVMFIGTAFNGLFDPLHEYPVLMLLWLYAGLALNLQNMTKELSAKKFSVNPIKIAS